MWSGTKTHRRTGPPVLTTPNTGKRGEKRAEGGNELDTRQGVGSSAHLKLDKGTVLTAGMASRRGTRLSSIYVALHSGTAQGLGLVVIAGERASEGTGAGRVGEHFQ